MVKERPRQRGVIPAHLKTGKYETEYQRLGVDEEKEVFITAAASGFKTEQQRQMFAFHNQGRRQPPVPSSMPAAQQVPPAQQVPHVIATEKPPAPPQTRVQVGNHSDELWADDQSFTTPIKAPTEFVDNNKYIGTEKDAVDRLQGTDPLASTAAQNADTRTAEEMYYQQPPATDQETWHEAHKQAEAEAAQQHYQPQQEGQYIVVMQGHHATFDSLAAAKRHVEDLILIKDISIKAIEVYKRLNIDFGVVVEE